MRKKRIISFTLVLLSVIAGFCSCLTVRIDENELRIEVPIGTVDSDTSCDTLNDPSADIPLSSEKRIHFLAAGDNVIHEDVMLDAKNRADAQHPGYNFYTMYSNISKAIKDADIAFVNQEGPVGVTPWPFAGYPNFNAPDQAGDTLVELGFDIVNIANNHMLDTKEKGLLETIDYWKKKDVLLIGAYKDAEDYDNIRVYEYEGIKIAFLSYTYGTNNMKLDPGSKHIIPLINETDIKRQIALAKGKADLVFVSLHWGNDYSETSWTYGYTKFTPTTQQVQLAQLIADSGADVILGHHPHVIQRAEWISGASGKKTLCIYSLGNMISTMHANFNLVGGFFTFDIVESPEGELYIDSPLFTPFFTHYLTNASTGRRSGIQLYYLKDYTNELVSVHGSQLRPGGQFDLAILRKYVTDNFSPEFLPDDFK